VVRQRSSRARRGATPAPGAGRAHQPPSALGSGLRLLAWRAHSRAELRAKLLRRGCPPDETEAALARLAELGYLDDQSFAQGLVRRRSRLRGPQALAAELAAKGIDRSQAADALAGFDLEAQVESASRLAERLCARQPVSTYREALDRVGAKLLRRGFSSRVIRAACRTVVAATAGDAGD
jgi:regulatory protein